MTVKRIDTRLVPLLFLLVGFFSESAQASCVDDGTCRLILRNDFPIDQWSATCSAMQHGGPILCLNPPAAPSHTVTGLGLRDMIFNVHPTEEDTLPLNLATLSVEYFLEDGTSWDPSSDGAIAGIDYSERRFFEAGVVSSAFLIRQGAVGGVGGVVYGANVPLNADSILAWGLGRRSCLQAGDFFNLDGLGSHPDFSAAGAPIEFGYWRFATNDAETIGFSTNFALDEFRAVLYQAPNPGCANGPAHLRMDLSGQLSWTPDGTQGGAGQTLPYQIVLENVGGTASSAGALTETVPQMTTWIPDSPPAWTCTPDAQAGSICTRPVPSLAPDDLALFDFTVRVNDGTVPQWEVYDEVSFGSGSSAGPLAGLGGTSSTADEDLADSEITLGSLNDLIVAVKCCISDIFGDSLSQFCPSPGANVLKHDILTVDSDADGLVDPGDTLTYEVHVGNLMNVKLWSASFTDTVDNDTTLICVPPPVVGVDDTVVFCDPNTGFLEVAFGDIESLSSKSVELQVTVNDPPLLPFFCNQGVAFGPTLAPEESSDKFGPFHSATCTTVGAAPGVTLSDDIDGPGLVDAGDTLTYDVEVANDLVYPAGETSAAVLVPVNFESFDVTLLYRLRDQVLTQTPGGRAAIELFYEFIGDLAATTLASPDAAGRALAFAFGWQPLFRALVEGGGDEVTIGPEHIQLLIDYVASLKASATSIGLLEALESYEALLNIPGWEGLTMDEWQPSIDVICVEASCLCPANMTLANQTLSGTQAHAATGTARLGPNLIVDGASILVEAATVTILDDTEIGGTFSAGNNPSCT